MKSMLRYLVGAVAALALFGCGQQSAAPPPAASQTDAQVAEPPPQQEASHAEPAPPVASEITPAPNAPVTEDRAAPSQPPPPAANGELASGKTRGLRRAEVQLPDFPWPPPTPSARFVLQRTLLANARTQFDVGERLTSALDRAGYSEYSFYRAPGGFALVARLERMREDGSSAPGDLRFLSPDTSAPFSLGTYVQQLFFAPEGYYRQIVFVTSDKPFTTNPDDTLTAGEAAQLLRQGANRLPESFRQRQFTAAHRVTALVYEFRKGARDRDVTTLDPGRLAGRTHLQRAGILPALERPN
ncbi:MAG: hypothetical protein JNJ73_12350 [Hyphomonadaceae bacterium]|nr:hypothetical protein [Hyphomonadaceae bacterium]